MRLKKNNGPLLAAVALSALAAVASCGGDDDDGGGTGGKGGSSGTSTGGKGGTAGSAGTGKGGTAGTGATTGGSAGSAGKGGTAGTAGTSGTSGAGGDSGAAGGGGVGGEPPVACDSPLPDGAGGEGGSAGAGGLAPQIIAVFDTPGSVSSWGIGSMPVPDTVLRRNPLEGASCLGALELTIPFTAYSTDSAALLNFSPELDWTGRTELHARVKILDPGTGNLDHINGMQLAVSSNNYSNYDSRFLSASVFDDFDWQEISLDLTVGSDVSPPTLNAITQIQVQLLARTSAPTTGPAFPIPTVMLVDDVWLE